MAFFEGHEIKASRFCFFCERHPIYMGFQENLAFFQKKSACQLQHLTFVIVFYPHAFLFLVPDR
jgi:hypothetical protein